MFANKSKLLWTNLFLLWAVGSVFGQSTTNYAEEAYFLHGRDTIFGKLILPKKKANNGYPAIIFVHGSGPEDYSSSNLYRPLWERFTEAGFACFSWNKPGVGASQGNWFLQSIEERANMVLEAYQFLEHHEKIDKHKIGLWGISQAGWIIPKVAEYQKPAFAIVVSGPVTTAMDQEIYRLRSNLQASGFEPAAVDSALTYTQNVKKLILEERPFIDFDALQKKAQKHDWSSYVITGNEGIYQYLKVILEDDQAPNIENLTCPVLAVWGENDLLVPPVSSSDYYRNTMKKIANNKTTIVIVPQADHTLTFNTSGKTEETIERRKAFEQDPENIFAPGYLDLMAEWIKKLEWWSNPY
ncbi:MAG: alpha/beta hydrolase [Bacteroidota bacterium]|nr:alpha/beta hydrolase [Bacteroidota bacterium]